MAIDFYNLGRRSGAKTPKGQQSGFQSLVSSATKPIEDMLKASQEKTAALTAAMPQGIPIDKVPEELRVKATEFLSTNKKAYTDATKVIASGINAQSERYKKAVETINSVNTRFENLSTSLEAVALKRQASLDDPMGYSPGTGEEDRLTWSNLGNGDLYGGMTFNEDGTVNYTDSKGESKSFADFNVSPQSFEGQNIFLGLNDKFTKQKYSGQTKDWSLHANEAESTVNQLFQKLKPAGQKDMMMADVPYLEKITGFEAGTNEYKAEYSKLLENPNEAIASYKSHILETLKNNYNAQKGPTNKLNNESGEWSFSSGKYLPVLGGNRQMPPSFANAMKISLQKAADGKETSFDFFDTKLTYDPKANDGQGNWYDDNNDYGSTSNLIKNTIKVTDPGFVKISSTSSSQVPIKLEALNIKTSAMLPSGEVYENGLVSGILKGSDKSVAEKINDIILNNTKNYKFVEYGVDSNFAGVPTGGYTGFSFNQEIMLLDGDGKKVIDPATKKPYHFKVNDGSRNSVNDVDADAVKLNELLQSLNIKLKPSI